VTDRITSRTITRITHEHAQNPPSGPIPAPEEILNSIVTKMEQIVAGERTQEGIDTAKAKTLLRQLQNVLSDIPEGFELATVAYSKIPTEESRGAMDEFSSRVKPQFLRYLAKHYPDELREMGICENGIGRMSNGHSPADKEGRLYSVSVDHIIERAGSGRMGQTKSIDADLDTLPDKAGNRETLQVNHMRNLILLPNSVHFECKNLLNGLQDMNMLKQGGLFRWSVMLVPKHDMKSPYVYVPTPAQQKKYGIELRSKSSHDNLSDAFLDLNNAVKQFNGTSYGKTLTTMCHKMALAQGKPIAHILREQEKTIANDNLPDDRVPLKTHFHQALFDYGPEDTKAHYLRILKLANEVRTRAGACFNTAKEHYTRTGKTPELHRLKDFFNSNKVKRSREKLASIPEKKLGSVNRILRDLDRYHKETLDLLNPGTKSTPKSTPKSKHRRSRRKGPRKR